MNLFSFVDLPGDLGVNQDMNTENICDVLNRVPATLLGTGSQPLSTGLAFFDTQRPLGSFWPQAPSNPDSFPSAVAILLESGETIAVWDFRRCQAGSNHFHFRIAKVYPGKQQ